jgi:farnesyl-diphosphate farnesyltransferase
VEPDAKLLLGELLEAVSRTFYKTVRVLPRSVRPQIGTAYLLARATDTIADTELVPVEQRVAALEKLRLRILGEQSTPVFFPELAAAQPQQSGGGSTAERVLLERTEEIISLLASFSAADQQRIREVLDTIVSGQDLDLRRFGHASAAKIVALQTDVELDDYTYRVAGCVGEFWTKMCRAQVFPLAQLDDASLLRDGVRFGKGLQLVNILRDLPRDLKSGRCYLPMERLARVQLKPADLLEAAHAPRLRPVYDELLDTAEAHLAAGWRYTNALPRRAWRVRLACAWPILIGVKTLGRLRRENPLVAERRVKVTREEVRNILLATLLRYPFRNAWFCLFQQARQGRAD